MVVNFYKRISLNNANYPSLIRSADAIKFYQLLPSFYDANHQSV